LPVRIHDVTRPDVAADQGWQTGQAILEGKAMCALLINQFWVITPFRNNVPRGEMPANFSARSSQK
jgi:hypothetical protein